MEKDYKQFFKAYDVNLMILWSISMADIYH